MKIVNSDWWSYARYDRRSPWDSQQYKFFDKWKVTKPYAIWNYTHIYPVFSLTLARSPMASRSYRRASDFLNYSPGLASDILAERKSEKKEEKNFF